MEACEIPQAALLPTNTDPPVSIIIPYKCGGVFNPIGKEPCDEVIVAFGGRTIGDARIDAVRNAKNEWCIQMDADADYPVDYISRCKAAIRQYGDQYAAFYAIRHGGFGNLFWKPYEHGFIHRKDYFLQVVSEGYEAFYAQSPAGVRTDVAPLFQKQGIPSIDVHYKHPMTNGEIQYTQMIGGMLIASFGIVGITMLSKAVK